MEEEDEICRVCRSEATPEQPLFHPCKCSGSIRYVHQECLTEWLSHSGKKYCELCEHPFTFTPVYRQDMPEVIPAKLFFSQLLKNSTFAITTASRAVLVSFVWLIILPFFTIWIWRMYFFLGTNLSQNLAKLEGITTYNTTTMNSTTTSVYHWLEDYKSDFSYRLFLSDCFKGQLIDCIVFIVFVAIFLLREWIIQNIPMEQPIVHEPPPPPQVFEQGPPSPTAEERQFFLQQGPPSPTAEEREFFYQQRPDAARERSLQERERQELRRLMRAGSVPPVLPSYNFRLDDDEYVPQHRAATVEPQYNPQQNFMQQPQHHFRPIFEEDEEEEIPPPPMNNVEEEEEEEEEDDENVEEFEGVLEAIGMQGSLWTLVQNSSLMGLLIALGLGVAVWIPYLFGMLFIMTDIIQLPLTFIRLLTDPILGHSDMFTKFEPLVKTAFHRYQGFAVGQSATDRVACIAVGYMIITALSCWYMAQGSPASLGRTAQEALFHQGIISKVGTIMIIELVVFPLICGYLLDVSTKPLFNNNTEFSYLSVFFHWAFGTAFMFMFAVLVTVCRDVVRPGVMWFIRDPNDPEFHPIREMVERPIMYQFRKIFMSLVIYTAVIIVGVGGTVHLVNKHVTGLFPIKWNSSKSATVLPIDLVVMQVGLPALMKYARPKQTMKRVFVTWVGLLCRQLRLTSFMLGGRHPQEEGRLVYRSWSAWLRGVKPSRYPDEGTIDNIVDNDVSYIWEGQLLKVPRHDSVPVVPRRRMLVPLDNYTLEPLDMMERRLGHPAARAAGGDELNTVIVYSPPQFKQRLWFFVGSMWVSVTVFFCAVTILPVMIGRYIFKHVLVVESDVLDMYSFVVGGSIMLGIDMLVSQLAKSLDEIVGQPNWQEIMASTWRQVKQWGSWTVRWMFFVVVFGLLIPITLGVLIELYFVMPLKQLGVEDASSMEYLPIWAHGFVCMNVVHGFIQIFPNNPVREVIENVFRGGVHQMKLELCLKKIIAPLFVMSLAAIGFPFITAYINMKFTALTNPEIRNNIIQIAYPAALVGIAGYYLAKLGSRIGSRFAQNIREDNYLIGRTLHNLE